MPTAGTLSELASFPDSRLRILNAENGLLMMMESLDRVLAHYAIPHDFRCPARDRGSLAHVAHVCEPAEPPTRLTLDVETSSAELRNQQGMVDPDSTIRRTEWDPAGGAVSSKQSVERIAGPCQGEAVKHE